MRLTRCFVSGGLSADAALVLPEASSAHLARVLRLRAGDPLILFDGRGGEYAAQIEAVERRGVRVRLGAHRAIERESPLAVTLLQCLVRAERMDLIVQKATELGVARIVPVQSRRAVVRIEPGSGERRRQHWQGVAVAACEQCGRNRIPELHEALPFAAACSRAAAAAPESARLLLEPDGGQPLAAALGSLHAPAALSLLVGPEGGFDDEELGLARAHGFRACTLGPRVLRAETAPLAALAAVQVLLGDLDGRDASMK